MGNLLAVWSFSQGFVEQTRSFHIQHEYTRPQYLADYFAMYQALPYAAHQAGRRRGFGIHQSSAIPLKTNEELLETVYNMQGKEARERGNGALDAPFEFSIGYILCVDGEHGGGYIDAVVFTRKGEDEHLERELAPCDVDQGLPLVGRR